MYSKILVALDRMIDAERTLNKAAALATHFQAELFVLGIFEPGPAPILHFAHGAPTDAADGSETRRLQEQIDDWAAKQSVRPQIEVRIGEAVRLIEHSAREFDVDLLVLGNIDHASAWGKLLEHSAERISFRTTCDVLIAR